MMAAQQVKQHAVWWLSELLNGFTANRVSGDCRITGIAIDSRQVKQGDLFLACHGHQSRGHEYVNDAVKNGAVAIAYETPFANHSLKQPIPLVPIANLKETAGRIADRFYNHPSRDLFVVGITGTNGKTSCCHFLANAFSQGKAVPAGVLGTLGSGLYGALTPSLHTTPDPVILQRILAELRDAAATIAVMEVSSHGVVQSRITGVDFDVAVFTNLSRDHLDYHGDMAAYVEAKKLFFASPSLRYAVINVDDPYGISMIEALPSRVRRLGYRVVDSNQTDIAQDDHDFPILTGSLLDNVAGGSGIKIDAPWGSGILRTSLLGRFNVSNLLAVLGVLLFKGVSVDAAISRLSELRSLPGRMETFASIKGKALTVVDYAHTPDALQKVLLALRSYCNGQLWCVFGCGGNRDKGKRPQMGLIAEKYADHVIITDDNPRFENPQHIVAGIASGMNTHDTVKIIPDRAAAIAYALHHAKAQDVVLIAGKGHEEYQEIEGVRLPYSDRQLVKELLRKGRDAQ